MNQNEGRLPTTPIEHRGCTIRFVELRPFGFQQSKVKDLLDFEAVDSNGNQIATNAVWLQKYNVEMEYNNTIDRLIMDIDRYLDIGDEQAIVDKAFDQVLELHTQRTKGGKQ